MKKFYIASLILLILISCTDKQSPCTIEIKQGEISQTENGNYIIPISLINQTQDSINYIDWACSWQELYCVQNAKFKIKQNLCFLNVPMITSIVPHGRKTVNLELINILPKRKSKEKVKIGFNLIETNNKKLTFSEMTNQLKKKNIIWTKEIEL